MKPEYEAYQRELIDACKSRTNYLGYGEDGPPDSVVLRAKCMEFTSKFVEKFPHLKRVSGFVTNQPIDLEIDDYGTEHWWCVEEDGTIVDPTEGQFSHTLWSLNNGFIYTVYDENIHPIDQGACPNCGGRIIRLAKDAGQHGGLCSDECFEDYKEYMSG